MATRPPLILLPPSEGKADGGSGPAWARGTLVDPDLDDRRAKVVAALVRSMKRSQVARAKLLGVKGDALAAATAANLEVLTAATLPAIERYTGVLYEALDAASLSASHRRRLAAQVRIFSGVWGLVGPADPIPGYKLKMGAAVAPLGKLSTWWRPAITAALADPVAGRTVWNLLPNEHAAAWKPDLSRSPAAPRTVISVRFLDEVRRGPATQLVGVNHWNKLLKGALVRHVLATQLNDVDGLVEFDHPLGYVFAPELTLVDPDGVRVAVSLVKAAER
jgi:cytoplasmic iron level regulating protein YaaA (DUF328/UPF0246 family)